MDIVNRLDMFSTGDSVKENKVTRLDKNVENNECRKTSALLEYMFEEGIDTFADEEYENNLKLIEENKILKEKIQMLEIEIENLKDKINKFRNLEKCNKGGRPAIAFDIEEYKIYKSIGYSNTEIADFMNVSLSTLKNRIKKVSI